MEIKREINGQEHAFELTPDERIKAYYEQEALFDYDDIVCYFESYSDEEIQEYYNISRPELESLFDDMAAEKRRNQDKYDMHWDSAREEAINTVLSRCQANE